MKDLVLYPRASGKWTLTIESLRQAWVQGRETVMYAGKVWALDIFTCPICGGSPHTSRHLEKLQTQ
jgi:hypothetical protein